MGVTCSGFSGQGRRGLCNTWDLKEGTGVDSPKGLGCQFVAEHLGREKQKGLETCNPKAHSPITPWPLFESYSFLRSVFSSVKQRDKRDEKKWNSKQKDLEGQRTCFPSVSSSKTEV